jgi:hypothetical protein
MPPRRTAGARGGRAIARAHRWRPPVPGHGLDPAQRHHHGITEHRARQLIRQPKPVVDRKVEIEFLDQGDEAYTFIHGALVRSRTFDKASDGDGSRRPDGPRAGTQLRNGRSWGRAREEPEAGERGVHRPRHRRHAVLTMFGPARS